MNKLERLLAFFLLILLSPVLLFFLFISFIDLRSKSLFLQKRIGQYGKPFVIYKIKTMNNGQITRLGSYLRKYKIDELPQLFNIIKGDMSFVGPRPDIPGYYDILKGSDRAVLEVKPGLTSLAALKYVNEEALLKSKKDPQEYNDSIIFPDKVQMNLDYCKKRSFSYDLYIIGLTLKAIFVTINSSINNVKSQ